MCSCEATNEKYAEGYRRRKLEDAAAITGCSSSRAGFATHASFLGADARAQALQARQKAIDKVGFVVTGDREYFYPGSSGIA